MAYLTFETEENYKEREYSQWAINNMRNVVHPTNNIDDLEDLWIKFNSMPYDHRLRSDDESLRLFGKTNQERYEEMKSKFLNTDLKTNSTNQNNLNEAVEEPLQIVQYKDNSIEYAKEWAASSLRVIIIPTQTLDELEELWVNFKSTIRKQQRESDWKSIELFGVDNQTHYNILKSGFLDSGFKVQDSNIQNYAFNESYIEKKCRFINTLDQIKDFDYITESIDELKTYDMTFCEEVMIKNLVTSSIDFIIDKTVSVSSTLIPHNLYIYYTPDELISMNVFKAEDETDEWFKAYQLSFCGLFVPDFIDIQQERIDKVSFLMNDLSICKETEKDEIKNKLLRCGWNPDMELTDYNVKLAANRIETLAKEKASTFNFINISESINNIKKEEIVIPKKGTNIYNLYPVYIVLLDDGTPLSNNIKHITKGPYSHVAIGFDSDLENLYSFNFTNKEHGGVSKESIKRYPSDKELAVFTFFVRKKDYDSLISLVTEYITNRDNTSYNYAGLISILFNIPLNRGDNKLVCSQFVDRLLKFINLDLTNKDSSLVTPNDLYRANKKNNKIYIVYEGLVKSYNPTTVAGFMYRLTSIAMCVKEYVILENSSILSKMVPVSLVYEEKEFPVQFNNDGDIIIKKMKKLDYNAEYAKSHKLLMEYDKTSNLEGIKYELAKLWFMNNLIEETLHKSTKDNTDLYKARAFILNDFKKFLNVAIELDKTFNFSQYYNSTPFSDNTIKINKATLKYTVGALKSLTQSYII